MTTGILAKLGLTSWDQASEWAKNRHYPCEQCVEYDRTGKCLYYDACKGGRKEMAIVFFEGEEKQPYQPDPRRGSVQG